MLGRSCGRLACVATLTFVFLPCVHAAAQSPETMATALFAPRGLTREESRDLTRALARELSVRVVHAGRVGERLAARAAEAEGADVAARVDARERAAMDAYVHLRFGPAADAFSAAIDATLEDPRRPADPARLAQLLFGRALVGLATQREDDAAADLGTALTLDPTLSPDEDRYGPPVLRAVLAARRDLLARPEATISVDRSPEDAMVWIDGREVPPSEGLAVRAGVRHLLTAARPGHTPRSQWVEVNAEGARVAVVVPRVSGPALALVALSAWERSDPGLHVGALDATTAPLVARALGFGRAVLAARDGDAIGLTLFDDDGAEIRSARGDAVDWEALPFTVLAALLAGRTLTPPSPADVALTVSAPNRVEPGQTIPIRVQLRDPERRASEVAARCGEAVTTLRLDDGDRDTLTLNVEAPDRTGDLACLVRALDEEGRALGAPPDALDVEIREGGGTPFYAAWYFWLAAGLVVAGGVAAAIIATQVNQEPMQVLRINGP
jgi:hypothetical protein